MNESQNAVVTSEQLDAQLGAPETQMPATGAESPNGANFRLVSPAGTWLQFTMRRGRMSAVIDDFRKLEKVLIAEGWTQPPSKEQSSAKGAAGEDAPICPIHHEPMRKQTNERGSWWSHKTADPRYASTKGYCSGKEPKGAE
jgi:hypothetical protein